EETDEKPIVGENEPDVFLVEMQVKGFDGAGEDLRVRRLSDLRLGNELQAAFLVETGDFRQSTAVVREVIEVDELHALNRRLLGVVLHGNIVAKVAADA